LVAVIHQHKLGLAVRCLAAGGLVAYPTEAVYGLGCNPWTEAAVHRILAVKRRSERKGLILIAADFEQLDPFIEPLDTDRMPAVLATWPGPVTWVFPARPSTPRWLTGARPTIAVRVTAHPVARALCRAWGGPLVSTSANREGQSPARTALGARLHLGMAVDLVLNGLCGGRSRPSTIRDGATGAVIRP
jgi:L-threonylcarbamoyladenylate synthase